MAYAAWHGWPSGALLPVYTWAMNPCQVGIGPMHLPNRVFAAFRWANRQRVKQARYAPFPSIWGLRHPVVLADTQQVARHQVVQPRSPLSSDMGSVTESAIGSSALASRRAGVRHRSATILFVPPYSPIPPAKRR